MEMLYYDLGEDLDHYVAVTDNEVLAELNRASRDKAHPGHFDAKCLYVRNYRFLAIALSSPPLESDLLAIKEELGIPDNEISWEFSKREKVKLGMHFPVLKTRHSIDYGDNLSEISVPPRERSWIYVAPQFEKKLRKQLNHVDGLG